MPHAPPYGELELPWTWGLLDVAPGDAAVVALFGTLLTASACLVVGFHTRLASAVVFVAILSLERRDPFVFNAGDTLIRVMALYLLLAPAGASLSLDHWRRARDRFWEFPARAPWALRLVQIQVSVIYLSTVWEKSQGETWRDGTSVSYALRTDDIQRFGLPSGVADSELVSAVLTYGTLATELAVGILIWNRRARPLRDRARDPPAPVHRRHTDRRLLQRRECSRPMSPSSPRTRHPGGSWGCETGCCHAPGIWKCWRAGMDASTRDPGGHRRSLRQAGLTLGLLVGARRRARGLRPARGRRALLGLRPGRVSVRRRARRHRVRHGRRRRRVQRPVRRPVRRRIRRRVRRAVGRLRRLQWAARRSEWISPAASLRPIGPDPGGSVGSTTVRIGNGLEVRNPLGGISRLTIRQSEPNCFEVREELEAVGRRLSAGPGCQQLEDSLVACQATLQLIDVDLNDGGDELHVFANVPMRARGGIGDDEIFGGDAANVLNGDAGDDRLHGGTRADTYVGGIGDDRIAAVDGVRDSFDCGTGSDTLSVDLTDPNPLPNNCDHSERSPVRSFPNLLVSLATVRVRGDGTVPLKVGCRPEWRPGCRGTLTLDDGRGRRPARLGSLAYRVRRGRIVTLAVPLTRRGRSYVGARRRSSLRVLSREQDLNRRPRTVIARLAVRAPRS